MQALADPDCGWFYRADARDFIAIPGAPIAYWASNAVHCSFKELRPLQSLADPRLGIQTGNNDLFLKEWFEPSASDVGFGLQTHDELLRSKQKWFPVASGGKMRRWYGNLGTVIDLGNDAQGIRELSKSYSLCNTNLYFKCGIAWTRVSSGKFATRLAPSGVLYEHSGPVIFCSDSIRTSLLGFLNSSTCQCFLDLLAPTLDYGATPIRQVPVRDIRKSCVNPIVTENILFSQQDWDVQETSWSFKRNPLV